VPTSGKRDFKNPCKYCSTAQILTVFKSLPEIEIILLAAVKNFVKPI
jgi:hypothetical protein